MKYLRRSPVANKVFFFYQGFLSRILTTHRTAGKGRAPSFIPLYNFHPLTNIQTFATLLVRWLSHIFNRTTCIYHTATRWDLPPYRITIWMIDDVTLVFVCLRDDLFLAFLIQQFEMGNRWIRTRIETLVLQANLLTKCASHPKTS